MRVEIKYKSPKQVPVYEVRVGSFFYYHDTLYIKTDIAYPNRTLYGVPVGPAASYADVFFVNEKLSSDDVLVQPVDVCIEIL